MKTWTFKLRKTNLWSDGTPLTAEDFLFSYERILSPQFGAKYSGMLHLMKNAKQFNDGEIKDFSKVGVKALDRYTLQIELNNPTPNLPEIVKHHTWFPVPKHAVLKVGKMTQRNTKCFTPKNAISNGAFRLKSFTPENKLEMIKNPNYWDAATVKLQGIKFLFLTMDATLDKFTKKQIHIAYSIYPESIMNTKPGILKHYRQEIKYASYFLRCNVTDKLKDRRVRKAISLVLQKEQIQKLLDLPKHSASSLIPSHDDYLPPKVGGFDLAKAKKLMTEAGYPNGKGFPALILVTTNRESSIKAAAIISKALKDHLGITTITQSKDWMDYLLNLTQLNYDLATGGWIADYLDPTTFLEMWKKGDGNNRTGWANKEYEKLLDLANNTANRENRLKLLAQAEKLLLEEYPIICLSHFHSNYLIQPEVRGWHPRLMMNQPYKFIRLSPIQK